MVQLLWINRGEIAMVEVGNFFYRYRNGILPVLFLGVFTPSPRIFENPIVALGIGLNISVLGQVIRMATIGLVYIIRGGKDGKVYAEDLVTKGIFNHCRNPLYVGNILVSTGMGIASNNLKFLVIITIGVTFIYYAIVSAEEDYLSKKFGVVYQVYMMSVNRWLPSFKGIGETFATHRFAWRRVLLKEYNSTFSGSTLALLLIAKSVHDNPHYFPDREGTYKALGIVWLAILLLYGWVRYMKKSKRMIAD